MINPLNVATSGYLCYHSPRNVLTVATSGYIGCQRIPIPPRPHDNIGWMGDEGYRGPSIEKGKRVKIKFKEPWKIELQNDVLMAIIKTFIKCQDENIL